MIMVIIVVYFLCLTGIRSTAVNKEKDEGESELGSFWQIADIHYDVSYSSPLIAPNLCLARDGLLNSSAGTAGEFGDYQCVSSWALVVSTIKAMKLKAPKPDFILWTGDSSVPHISESSTSIDKIYSTIYNVTELLVETFPGISIYPMLGNHDVSPVNQVPVRVSSLFYDGMLGKAGWDTILGETEQRTFKKGGYFSKVLGHGLRLICLNSNLWYTADKLSKNETDPADQFHWLELEMQDAMSSSEKVILAGHVPPGVSGRALENSSWMYPMFNNRLQWLMQRYGGIISAAIFGHEHTDSFRIVYDNGRPVIPLFMAPAVTPWNIDRSRMGSNNPAIRLYRYSRSTGLIKDYTQYYLNLSDANAHKEPNWEVEYRAQKSYNLTVLDAKSLDALVSKFKENDNVLFKRFYRFNSVCSDRSPCTGDCKRRHICSMTNIDAGDYNKCCRGRDESSLRALDSSTRYDDTLHRVTSPNDDPLQWPTTRDHHHHHHKIREFTYYLLGAVLILLVILFFVVAFCCCRRRHAVVLLGRSRYTPIQEA